MGSSFLVGDGLDGFDGFDLFLLARRGRACVGFFSILNRSRSLPWELCTVDCEAVWDP